MSKKLLATSALTPILLLAGAMAAFGQQVQFQSPAVAYPNLSVGVFGGAEFGGFDGGTVGTFTMPLGQSFGAQIDGLTDIHDSEVDWQLAGHSA